MSAEKRTIAKKRAKELKSTIEDYLEAKKRIPKGLEKKKEIQARRKRILEVLGGTEADFGDYRWQLKNRITDVETLKKFITLTPEEVKAVKEVEKQFRWAISPHYLTLVDPDDPFDPIKLMAMPTGLELRDPGGNPDPMSEEFTNPAGTITRRYPDRLIINITNVCAMYCRFCQRRRDIGEVDEMQPKGLIEESIDYIRENREIRDVLLTGGDPFTMPTDKLEWILKELTSIEHVEYVRIGSRVPVTMPQLVTDEFVAMLKKYHPVYVNTHFNHPMEVTEEAKTACERLADAGIPLGNQAVLLNGINNDKYVMRVLNHELLKIRVKPYYIFHAKAVKGTTHFNTSIDDGIEIMEYLRGYTSGMAIPAYIVNAEGGKGKTPILPEYLVSRGKDYFTIRTWEGEVLKQENRPTLDIEKALQSLK